MSFIPNYFVYFLVEKIYSDSSFYNAPGMSYPTIQDQVAMCKEIATLLESGQNKRSRGGRMFSRRKQRAEEWSMDSQGTRYQAPITQPSYQMHGDVYHHPGPRREFGYQHVRHHPDPIKSKLSMDELERMQQDPNALCHHDELPPNIAFDVTEALSHSRGKAAQIFAKRKARAEKYTVDEVPEPRPPATTLLQVQVGSQQHSPYKPYVSPWETAMAGQPGVIDQNHNIPINYYSDQAQYGVPAFAKSSQQPAQQQDGGRLEVQYKTFRPVRMSELHQQQADVQPRSQTLPRARTRLDAMISQTPAERRQTSNFQESAVNYQTSQYNQPQPNGAAQHMHQQGSFGLPFQNTHLPLAVSEIHSKHCVRPTCCVY